MSSETFVYVTYIATTPDRVWQALIDGELTRQYWGNENVSDWQPGSKWEHVSGDEKRTVRVVGEVLEAVPNRRLVMTWAEPANAADRSAYSRVAMDIEPVGDMVRLTVTHDQLDPASDMPRRIGNGWPRVLSSLKSFLETGRPLNTWA
ncbi:MAG TPA: SRPBCC family protein [Candidatus Kapabacteria bacterium]|nr:SRPBCC family protein [Candidatus Kapabacteria bacterium]